MEKAKISEVFSSIQGEGIYAGRKEIFVRFSGCNLNCVFCDTDNKRGKFYTVKKLAQKISKHSDGFGSGAKWLTLTGGEPLLWSDFLEGFLLFLNKKYKISLETNGTLPDRFKRIKDLVDLVALDFKLPSSTKEKPFWKEHQKFLKLAGDKSFVKAVITGRTTLKDLKKAVKVISDINQEIPFVLLPASAYKKFRDVPRIEKVLQFQEEALKFIPDVRIIPQVHKFLKLK